MRCAVRPFFLSFIVYLLSASPAFSDCKAHYDAGVQKLADIQKDDTPREQGRKEAFIADFQALVERMKAEKCLPELMSLFQHSESEKQKYPAPDPAPTEEEVHLTPSPD